MMKLLISVSPFVWASFIFANDCHQPLREIPLSKAWKAERAKTLKNLKAQFENDGNMYQRQKLFVLFRTPQALETFKKQTNENNSDQNYEHKRIGFEKIPLDPRWAGMDTMVRIDGPGPLLYLIVSGVSSKDMHWFGFQVPPLTPIQSLKAAWTKYRKRRD